MLDWESVNDVNTPMAYMGISQSTSAFVTISNAIDATDKMRMPLLNTSRWPRLVSCLGRKLSAAVNDSEAWEVGEARVGRQAQHQRRRGLEHVEQHMAERRLPEDEFADLGDDGGCSVLERSDVHVRGEDRQAEEHHGEDQADQDERLAGVAPAPADGRPGLRPRWPRRRLPPHRRWRRRAARRTSRRRTRCRCPPSPGRQVPPGSGIGSAVRPGTSSRDPCR